MYWEAVPTIIMQKIAKNIKEVLITGKKSQKKRTNKFNLMD